MATYTVKAPDGKTVTLEGPDGASQADIIAQAQSLYQPKAVAAARPIARPTARPAANPQTAQYLEKYNGIRNGVLANVKPEQRDFAMNRFDSDPRAQKLRQLAGLAALSTRQGDVRAVAKKASQQRTLSDLVSGDTPEKRFRKAGTELGETADGWQSAAAGIRKGMFGVPDMLAAAGERYLPSAITGNHTDASYSNILQMIRGKTDAQIAANPGVGLIGEFGGAIGSGSAAGKLIKAGASRLIATGAPTAVRIGQAVESAATLRKGQKLANAAKITATGAAAGGVQAAGTGEDIGTGVVTGAVAAPIVGGILKVGQIASRPFRDVMRLSSASRILSRLTTSSRDQLERLAATYRQATGAEPTLFELLPLADRNKILKTAVVGKDNVVEAASNAIRRRAGNLGPEMSNRARQILTPQRDFIHQGITRDMTAARGGQLLPEDAGLIANAMDDPTHMLALRDEEARAIMAPHNDTPVVHNLEDLYPQAPGPAGGAVNLDPEVATVIRSAAGTLRARPQGAGVTAGDITDMMTTLRGDLGEGGIAGRTAQNAIEHLQGTLDELAPDAGAAARQMTDAYAARSRMAEGMQEGSATRLRADNQVGTNRGQARRVRNAYDTTEGAGGRSLGQGNKVLGDLGGSPEEALRATVRQSRGSTGRAVAQNVGPVESDLLAVAARAQDESAQALASASQKAQSGSGDGADAEMLVQAIAGLHPSSFITTKAGAVRRLLDMTYIPESRARTIVDMVFSQDPAMQSRALAAIGNEANGARAMKALAQIVGQGGVEINSSANLGAPMSDEEPVDDSPVPSVEADLTGLDAPVEAPVDAPAEAPIEGQVKIDPNKPYGRAVVEAIFPGVEVTEDIRDPNSKLARENPGSYHLKGDGAVDVRPIPGMTFEEFINELEASGANVIEKIDEVNHPSKHATGPHWHVVLG